MFRIRVSLIAILGAAMSATPLIADEPQTPPAAENGAQAGLLSDLEQEHQLLWQQAERTFLDLEERARKLTVENQYDDARKLASEGQYVIERNRRYSRSPQDLEAWRNRANSLISYVDGEHEAFLEDVARRKQMDLVNAERERIARVNEAREQKIALLKNQSEELRKERKYDEAIQVLKQVLTLDPTDHNAAYSKQVLEDFLAGHEARNIQETKRTETQDTFLDTDEASIPWHSDIIYPKNWLQISSIRRQAADQGEDETTLRVRSQLNQTVPDVNFEGISFEEVIQYLADLTTININANWPALEQVAIERDNEVTLSLKEVSAKKVLEEVLEQVGAGQAELSYDIDGGVLTVSTKEDLARRTLVRVYDVADLLIDVPQFPGQGPAVFEQAVNQGGQGGGGGGGGGGFGGGGGGGGQNQGIFGQQGGGQGQQGGEVREDQVTIEALIQLIQATIDPESWRVNGGNIGGIAPLRNQLIVTQTSSAHQELRDLLKQLREAHAIQIAVEARFISITRNYLEQIGVDLDVVLNNGNAGFDRAGFEGQPLRDPATGNLVLVPRDFSRLGLTPLAPGGLGFSPPTQPFPQPFAQPGLVPNPGSIGPASSRFTPIPFQNNTLDLATPVATNIPGTLGGAETLPALSLFGSFLDNIQVDFLVRATQVENRSSDLDAPRLVLFNGQRSSFSSFVSQDYVASLTPVLGDNVGLFTPQLGQANSGRELDVEATVSADRRYVTMTLVTFVIQSGDPVPFQFTSGSQSGGAGFLQLVRRTTNTIRTTVSVPDGGTLLIGGMKLAAERERDAGVPVLSRIPVLKRAFSNTSLVKDNSVLLILVKPKIIIQEEAEDEAFPTLGRTN